MIVLIVLGLITAIAIPNFMSTRERARRNSCILILKHINEAKSMCAVWEVGTADDEPAWGDLVPDYLKKMPVCPSNGTYSIDYVDENPTCSVSGHELL